MSSGLAPALRRRGLSCLRVGELVEGYDWAARFAAYAAGQAACVGHVAERDLGAAAYAIKTARSARPCDVEAGRAERDWQRDRLPDQVRALVLEDQARRNDICWSAFSD